MTLGGELEPVGHDLIAASRKRRTARRTLKRGAIAALVLLTITAGVAALYAHHQRSLADDNARRAATGEAAAIANARAAEANAQRAARERALAIDARVASDRAGDEARHEAAKATEISNFLQDMLRSANPESGAHSNLTVRDLLSGAVIRVQSEFRDRPEVLAELLLVIGEANNGLGYRDRAAEVLKRALAVRDESDPTKDLQYAKIEWALAEDTTGDEQRHLMDDVIAIRRRILGDTDPLVAKTVGDQSWMLGASEGDTDEDVIDDRFLKSLSGLTGGKKTPEDLRRELVGVISLARERWRAGDHQGARDAVRAFVGPYLAIPVLCRAVPSTVAEFARSLDRRQDIDAAEALVSEALELSRQMNGDLDSETGIIGFEYSKALRKAGRSNEAEPLAVQALKVYERDYGEAHANTVEVRINLAEVLLENSKPSDAAREIARVAIMDAHGTPRLWTVAACDAPHVAEWLIGHGENPLAVGPNGVTAMHGAAAGDSVDCIRLLMRHNLSVDPLTKVKESPLFYAAEYDSRKAGAALIDAGADVNRRNSDGGTPLHTAAIHGAVETARLLIARGADVNAATHDGSTALHMASTWGKPRVASILIRANAHVDSLNAKGYTPLCLASVLADDATAAILLDAGASVGVSDNDLGNTPLHNAAWANSTAVVKLLLAHGASPRATRKKDAQTPLHEAVIHNSTDVMPLLVSAGADVNAADADGLAPLHYAAAADAVPAAEWLLDHGASLTSQTHVLDEPLHVAAKVDAVGVVRLLISKNASIEASGYRFMTPLIYASTCKNSWRAASLLVESGADVNARRIDGVTALHFAAIRNADELAAELLAKGADANVADFQGQTPLHYAARDGSLRVLRLLLDKGASPTAVNSEGKTPLDLAGTNADVLRLLGKASPAASQPK